MKKRKGYKRTEEGQLGRWQVDAALTVGVICAMWLAFTVADLVMGDRIYSEKENRLLASRPEFSWESVLDGSFMKDYESYVTDQFVGRDKWIRVKTRTDVTLQKREINGVYLCKDGSLIEQHLAEDYPQELVDQKLELLNKLVERWDAQVMLVPTADNILSDKLPDYAEVYDQWALMEQARDSVGEENFIDIFPVLWEHREEPIYYRTDHHWTSRGAYYGYLTWAKETGHRIPRDYDIDDTETVARDFYGTLHSKINLPVSPDTIEYYPNTERWPVQMVYDLQKKSDSFYEESYLDTKNKYGYFLDDNHAFIEIDTGLKNGKTLFVLKDSYANCMLPLLATYYEKIYVADLRYMNGKLFPFMESYEPEEGMDVLVLYNCVHFLEEFRYW